MHRTQPVVWVQFWASYQSQRRRGPGGRRAAPPAAACELWVVRTRGRPCHGRRASWSGSWAEDGCGMDDGRGNPSKHPWPRGGAGTSLACVSAGLFLNVGKGRASLSSRATLSPPHAPSRPAPWPPACPPPTAPHRTHRNRRHRVTKLALRMAGRWTLNQAEAKHPRRVRIIFQAAQSVFGGLWVLWWNPCHPPPGLHTPLLSVWRRR